MSGIIHINGKQYDEEGNLIAPKKQTPKLVDGIVGTAKQPLKTLNINPTPTTLIVPREIQKPPTTITQVSKTLSRIAVKKPAANEHRFMSDIAMPIIRHKKLVDHSKLHSKHPEVKRVAKLPSITVPSQKLGPKHTPSFVPIRKTEEMIQAQLEAANAHLMTFKKPHITNKVKNHLNRLSPLNKHFVMATSILASFLIFSGTLVSWNMPTISLMIANKKAGFTAYLPAYVPNGYRVINPVGYTPGRIIIGFKSNTNDMHYSIEQKPTGWTSEILRDQVASSNGSQYQTQYVNGLTVYFTNENNATWVDRGILFTLQGESGLSSDQIASIAASM
jgi:hypothetical protein